MSNETINHEALQVLVESGVLTQVQVIGRSGGWGVTVKCGSATRTLTQARRKKAKVFRKMDSVRTYLEDLGIKSFNVDATGYEPPVLVRPDTARRLRKIHEQAQARLGSTS